MSDTEPATEPAPDVDTDDEGADDAEQGEGGEEGEPGEQPAAAPPQPSSEAEIERRTKQLENEAARHGKRVAEIMGDDFALTIACPLDFTPGYLFDPAQVPLPDQVRAQVLELLGQAAGPELKTDPDKTQCEACEGLGLLLTGSKVANQQALPCVRCNGQGWTTVLHVAATTTGEPGVTAPAQPMALPTPPLGPTDQWGRPPTHPHFNIPPAQVGA